MHLSALYQQSQQSLLTIGMDKFSEENVGNGNPYRYAEYAQRCKYAVVHGHRDLTDDAVHVDEGKERTIHQYTRYHWYYARDGDAMMGSIEPADGLGGNEADQRGANQ